MKITIIFPARSLETARPSFTVMPLALTLLAALTPDEHEVSLVDMFMGDQVDYESDVDLVAITVRTPLAVVAYEIADNFLKRGKKVVLGGPHMFAFPAEAKQHASAVAVGEAENLWRVILEDAVRDELKDFYVCGPYEEQTLPGRVHHEKQRPDLKNLPMMRRDLLPRKRYFMDSIFTTRGCPNHCRFCPVTDIFGPKIRHRPIDDVVAEVDTLGKRYFNVDDSVFGHPQMVDRPQENRYYLDLYRELARLRPKRLWSGAGGLSAINYKDGRKILELAAESGLYSIAAGLESISAEGQKQSGAWRKLHYKSPDSFDLQQTKDNIRAIQSLGIEVMGFFIIGWDEDTPETYRRTLEFCDECNIVPFIFTLIPMPGSQIYREYVQQGRIFPDSTWDQFGGGYIVYQHPTMTAQEMFDLNAEVMLKGYSLGRIFKRTFQAMRYRFSPDVAAGSFFTQLGLRKVYRQLYGQVPRPPQQ
ncbi:MAG: radical SAM protein [Deltaproteobacteria bacterium]|nr:radical SAM protein [Deltaproteobacteria bacterium]MBW1962519.1 radical SAM protein [Deltaproteobacteria bacterium]MBW2154563.1 radical SAM protein [Deltaproteobacteria bacterium]